MSLSRPKPIALSGAKLSFGVVAARYNTVLVEALLSKLLAGLKAAGVKDRRIEVVRVPGSHEVPVAAQWLAQGRKRDCVVALGVLIGGDTNHHEMVGQSVSQALQQVSLSTSTPVINGVVVADTLKQAHARCLGPINRGAEFAHAALEMAALNRAIGGKS